MAVRIDMPRIFPSLETKKTSARLPEEKRKEIIKSSLLHQRGSPGVWNRTACVVVVNVASSVGIVVTNKWVFEKYKFQFGTMLTVIHFSTTFLGLYVCSLFRLFQPKPIPLSEILGVVLAFCGFVVLTNLSLQHNSVGFYQLTKTLTTPTIMLVQTFFYGVSFSSRIQLALAVTCIGIILASVTDVQLNPLGTTYALAGVLITSLYQIWVGTKQKEMDVDAWQLLYNQAPLSAGILLVFVPLLDDVQKLRNYPFTKESVFAIAFSGILAFAVNISIFMIIGRTSPIMYNVVGHFKTCLILAMGVLLFSYPVNHKNFTGITIALTGTRTSIRRLENDQPPYSQQRH